MDKQDDPNYVFEYDDTSKSKLRWKNPKVEHLKGKECGTLTVDGSWAVQFRGKPRLVSRIVWEMFKGEVRHGDTVLFKDGDKSNPSLSNLDIVAIEEKVTLNQYIDNNDWANVFDYEDGKLYWKASVWSGYGLNVCNARKGDPLCVMEDKDGYYRAKIKHKVCYIVHRVIYEMFHGKIPKGYVIDHIDGDVKNNTIENLRLTTPAGNSRNGNKLTRRNKTGKVGVRVREDKKSKYYVAIWNVDGKTKDKSFSCNKYGDEEAFRLASEYRDKMLKELNKVYGDEGYTDRHMSV